MDQASFDAALPILDELDAILDRVLDSDELADVRLGLHRLKMAIDDRYGIELEIRLLVVDHKRADDFPLLTMFLSGTSDPAKPTYRSSGSSTFHKYVVDGSVQVVPHDRCPRCYGQWYDKRGAPCEGCGASLGGDVKLLLDTGLCPNCERGRVSATEPKCAACGFKLKKSWVAWDWGSARTGSGAEAHLV